MDMGPLYLYNFRFIKTQHVAMKNQRNPVLQNRFYMPQNTSPLSREYWACGLHDLLQFQVGFLSLMFTGTNDGPSKRFPFSSVMWHHREILLRYIFHGYKATLSSVQTEAALHRHFYFFQTSPWRARSCRNQKCVICKIQSVKVYPILSSIGCASIQVKINFPVNNQHY